MEIRDYKELLDFCTKALSAVTTEMRVETIEVDREIDKLIIYNLCLTTKDANTSAEDLKNSIAGTLALKRELIKTITAQKLLPPDALWDTENEADYEGKVSEMRRKDFENVSAHSLREMIISGIKGVATYSYYAYRIGYEDEGIYPFLERVLQRTLKFNLSVGLLFNLAMEVGGFGYRAMGLLDQAASNRYGSPKIANVELSVRKNPAVLFSGQDLRELEMLLVQSEGEGIDVYTHDDMISAHGYPGIDSFDHFAGNWGGCDFNQNADFDAFTGPIVVSGSGVKAPLDSYKDRLFTVGICGIEGVKHVEQDEEGSSDFSEVIKLAKKSQPPQNPRLGEVLVGFAHEQLESMQDMIVGALNDKTISRIVCIVGNDSTDDDSCEYYTNFVRELPLNAAVMTAGTVKYRFSDRSMGTVHGIPRMIDVGSVADVYSIETIAIKLQSALEHYDINKVPMSFMVTLNDEKSVTALLSLIYIGVKNIYVGPASPAWLSPEILEVFTKNFGIRFADDPEQDCSDIFSGKKVNMDGPIDTNMLIIDLIEKFPEAANILMDCGMSCVTCGAALYESLAEACAVHGLDPDDVKEVLDHELGLVEDDD